MLRLRFFPRVCAPLGRRRAVERSRSGIGAAAAGFGVALALSAAADATPPTATTKSHTVEIVTETSIAALRAELAAGTLTAQTLTQAYEARIAALDVAGPALHSVIALNPHALDDARRSDQDRAAGKTLGPLAGIPVLIKDNIESADGTATTAGSNALAANVTGRDAPLVARLKRAGAIILGKTNLSEWANFRSSNGISGWSAIGGLVKNPNVLDRTACGSSSGTGAAVAASLAAAGIGTETDGSITCPAALNGLVGFKPTLGLVSRNHIVPISHHQDTAGPMGRSVADVAVLLSAIAGSDRADPATRSADRRKRDYVAAVAGASLRGKRLGVARFAEDGLSPAVKALFGAAVVRMRAGGAQIVELAKFKPDPALGGAEHTVLINDFKTDLNAYLATTAAGVTARSLHDLIAFNRADPRELALFGQERFEQAQATSGPRAASYHAALATCARLARTDGLDRLIAGNRLDAVIAPSFGAASRIDVIDGDGGSGGGLGSLAAVAGYPHLTVPMGRVAGLPIGVSFVGTAWSDASILALGAAYEAISHKRRPPAYLSSIESTPNVERLLRPEHGSGAATGRPMPR